MIAAPLIGKYLHRFGRRSALLWSVIIIGTATAIFALAGLIDDDIKWYSLSIVARCTQGLGEAILIITIPSIIALEYPEKKGQYIGFSNMSGALGLTMGPVIATIINKWLGYVETLLVFSALILVMGSIAVCSLPAHINKDSK